MENQQNTIFPLSLTLLITGFAALIISFFVFVHQRYFAIELTFYTVLSFVSGIGLTMFKKWAWISVFIEFFVFFIWNTALALYFHDMTVLTVPIALFLFLIPLSKVKDRVF